MTFRKTLLLAGALMMIGAPASFAQDAAATKVDPAEMQERLKYAAAFQDVRPVRDVINESFETVSLTLPEAEREEFMRFVQLRVDYDKIEELSIKTIAELYTVPELKAMIAYYGSQDGKTAEAKAASYTDKISPEITKVIDAALMDAKYGPPPTE